MTKKILRWLKKVQLTYTNLHNTSMADWISIFLMYNKGDSFSEYEFDKLQRTDTRCSGILKRDHFSPSPFDLL